MNKTTTNRMFSQKRSLCAGDSGVMATAVAGISRRPRIYNFSPVPIIRKFPAAPSALAGLRNKSHQPRHHHHTSTACRWRPPAPKAASRHGPPGWPKQFFQAEFVGLKRSRQPALSGRNQSAAFQP
jgi:hypothetical protein